MKFISTRGNAPAATFGSALTQGLAPDGGLYMPEAWPSLPLSAFEGAQELSDIANVMLRPFVEGDAIAAEVANITRDAFDFPAPLNEITADGRLSVLELFHGPTAAFKDFGARFLAAAMQRLRAGASRPLNILVATSGDTGGAVAAAFHRRPGVVVSVLFPKGLVSPTQERQLTCWGDNVHSFRVGGSFDDCQRLVKDAFVNPGLKARFDLSSANSINLGRLLPQAVYYAATSLAVYRQHGVVPNFIIPSGNLGNSVACVWARKLGLPIGRIVLAHNANRTVPGLPEDRRVETAPQRAHAGFGHGRGSAQQHGAHARPVSGYRRRARRRSCGKRFGYRDPGAYQVAISTTTGKSGVRTRPQRPRFTPA